MSVSVLLSVTVTSNSKTLSPSWSADASKLGAVPLAQVTTPVEASIVNSASSFVPVRLKTSPDPSLSVSSVPVRSTTTPVDSSRTVMGPGTAMKGAVPIAAEIGTRTPFANSRNSMFRSVSVPSGDPARWSTTVTLPSPFEVNP